MTYVGIGLRLSGKFYDNVLLAKIFVFALQALSSPAPMSFLHAGTSSEVPHPGASPSSLSLPSEGREEGGGFSWCPWVASWGSSSPPARLLSSERGGGASGRSFGARELASVSSVHLWTGDPGVALLRRTPATRSVPVGSPSSSLHALRGDGAGESSGALFCSRLPLPPHLSTLCKVVRRESLPSSAPVTVPPWLPDLRLGKPGRCFEPALGRMALVIGLVAHAVASLSVLGLAVVTLWAWIVSFVVFPCAVVGGLWTASSLIAFALVVSVWPLRDRSDVTDRGCCRNRSWQQL